MNILKPVTLTPSKRHIAVFVIIFIISMLIIVAGSFFTSPWLNLLLLLFVPAFILIGAYSKGYFTAAVDGLHISGFRKGHEKLIPTDSIYKVFHAKYFHYTVRAVAEAVIFVDHNGKMLTFVWGYNYSSAQLQKLLESFDEGDIVQVEHVLTQGHFKRYVKENPSPKTTI